MKAKFKNFENFGRIFKKIEKKLIFGENIEKKNFENFEKILKKF